MKICVFLKVRGDRFDEEVSDNAPRNIALVDCPFEICKVVDSAVWIALPRQGDVHKDFPKVDQLIRRRVKSRHSVSVVENLNCVVGKVLRIALDFRPGVVNLRDLRKFSKPC